MSCTCFINSAVLFHAAYGRTSCFNKGNVNMAMFYRCKIQTLFVVAVTFSGDGRAWKVDGRAQVLVGKGLAIPL